MIMKIGITTLLVLAYYILYSQTESVLWPISGTLPGENILYQPQDYIGDELNFGNLFIGGNAEKYVIAPCDGIVTSVSYTYLNSLTTTNIASCNFPSNSNISEYDTQIRDEIAKELGSRIADRKFISLSISIKNSNKEKYWISGLRPYQVLRTGYHIKKGDTIGTIGYAYHKIQQPSICVSKTKYGKPTDPMTPFGLSSSFIPPKLERINYLTHKHSREKLLEDFTIFRESLEEAHPGLYDYISKEELNQSFNAAKKSISNDLTSEQFRKVLTQILSQIRDSHTNLYPRKYRIVNDILIPIRFGLQDSSLIVYQTLNEYQKYLGKKIVSVNDQDVNSLVQEITNSTYGSDGYIKSQLNRKLLARFDREYFRLHSLKPGDKLKLEFEDSTVNVFTCNKLITEDFTPKWKNPSPLNNRIEIKQLNSLTAILDLNTFELLRKDLDTIDRFIERIEQDSTQNLIIDLRDNLGGSPESLNHIFSHIANIPFSSCIASKVNQNDTYKMFANCYNYAPTHQNVYPNHIKIEGKEGYYLPDSYFKEIIPNESIHFSGNVIVLINEYSCSASTVFAALVQKHKRGIIIGRETGSSYHQLNATNFARVNLKNSGLELSIPLVKTIFEYKDASDAPWGRGVIPDYSIDISYSDFLDDTDRTLAYALETIKLQEQSIWNKKNNLIYLLILAGISGFITVYFRKKKKAGVS